MFFDGTIAQGISKALGESKAVVCFIADDTTQTRLFQDVLQETETSQLLIDHSVVLKLDSGSTDAGFLAAYCSVDNPPVIAVLKDGAIKAVLNADLDARAVRTRLRTALHEISSEGTSKEAVQQTENRTDRAESAENRGIAPTATQGLNDVFAERKKKLEAQKKAKDAEEKAERERKAKIRKEELEAEVLRDPSSKKAREIKHSQEQRRIKEKAKLERERILRSIEDDKLARKEKEEQRRQLRQLEQETKQNESRTEPSSGAKANVATSSDECVVQIRTFDGTPIRMKFSTQDTLSEAVRSYVDRQRLDGDAPYTFKQTLHPPPHRLIDVSEEDQTLESLGLTPNATLVLVPVEGYTSAYQQGGGIVSSGLNMGYGLVSSGLSLVGSAVNRVVGGVPAASTQGSGATEETIEKASDETSRKTTGKIRTLTDAKTPKDDQQFYNGNQLNFEPRKDD